MGCTPLIPAVPRWQITDQTFPSYLPSFPECIINKHAPIAPTVPVLEPPLSCGFRSSGLGMGTWSQALCQPHSVGTPGCSPSLLPCPWWGKTHLEARICPGSHESLGPGTAAGSQMVMPSRMQGEVTFLASPGAIPPSHARRPHGAARTPVEPAEQLTNKVLPSRCPSHQPLLFPSLHKPLN